VHPRLRRVAEEGRGVVTGESAGQAPAARCWLERPERPAAHVRLFCFGHAGAGGREYASWPEALPEAVEVCSVVLPGRGPRRRQGAYTRMEALIETLVPQLLPLLDRPFALFGHSLGALVAFEAARELRRRGLRPCGLFVAGCPAPHLVRPGAHEGTDGRLLEDLWRAGGTPAEVLNSPELMALLLPVIRADLAIYGTYRHAADDPLECAIVALGGTTDGSVTSEELEAWRAHTAGAFERVVVSGGHFFVQSARDEVLARVRRGVLRFAEAQEGGDARRREAPRGA
jgi:medium-chain acyl-[acyl-carrier-protein] hydrolase